MQVELKIKVTPLAYESMGVRSMCTLLETRDVRVLADAGVSLGPRFRLMPHPLEYKAMREARERIEAAAAKSRVTTVSHYHNDHHTPNFEDPVWLGSGVDASQKIYKDRTVLVKDYRSNINTAQRRRGWLFKQTVEEIAEEYKIADGQTYTYGRTTLTFSKPVPHGEGATELGWVIILTLESRGEKVIFAPDVQGPVVEETVQLILDASPDLAIVGGPPTYLQGFKVAEEFVKTAEKNILRLAEHVPNLVVDHHLLRDSNWSAFLQPIRNAAGKAGNKVFTAAELMGEPSRPLENRRKEMYEEQKPSKEFLKWARLPKEKQRLTAPPLS